MGDWVYKFNQKPKRRERSYFKKQDDWVEFAEYQPELANEANKNDVSDDEQYLPKDEVVGNNINNGQNKSEMKIKKQKSDDLEVVGESFTTTVTDNKGEWQFTNLLQAKQETNSATSKKHKTKSKT